MKLRQAAAPFFRLTTGVRDIMLSQLLACSALLCAGIVLHGIRAVVMALFGILGGTLIEILWRFSSEKQQNLSDFQQMTAPVTGLLCALMLPASCSVWLPFFAAMFAMAVARLPFGGETGRSPFCGAAAGFCFAATVGAALTRTVNSARLSAAERAIFDALPDKCFAYIKGYHSIFSTPQPVPGVLREYLSPNMLLRADSDPGLSTGKLLGGNYNGGMGATLGLLIIVCAVWLTLRSSIAWEAAASCCASVAVFSFIFPWEALTRPMSVVYDLMTGYVLFAAVFLCGDMFTAPHIRSARISYGAICGALALYLRRRGMIEGGEIFAVMIMNALSDPLDRLSWRLRSSGFSVTEYLRGVRNRLRKKLRIGLTPIDELDDIAEAERMGREGDLSVFGKNTEHNSGKRTEDRK